MPAKSAGGSVLQQNVTKLAAIPAPLLSKRKIQHGVGSPCGTG